MSSSKKRSEKKERKRKQGITEDAITVQTYQKRLRLFKQESEPERVEEEQLAPNSELGEGLPWRNLGLIRSIEDKSLDLHKKMELAFDFVTSKVAEENGDSEDCETVKMSRLLVFLNHWVQSLLSSSAKEARIGGDNKPDIEAIGTFLDFRCWKVLKFCLESASKRRVSLSVQRDILLSIRFVVENTVKELKDASSSDVESYFDDTGFELHRTMLDCVDLIFSSHGGLTGDNLELWLSTVVAVLELVHRNTALFAVQLSCSIFDPFAKFLRANPTSKNNGFYNFVHKLLEPLLRLLGVLLSDDDGLSPDWKSKLVNLTEDVLSYGLFHPVQIDGFFGLNSTEKYVSDRDENGTESKTVMKSYHRHLFAKLRDIVASKNELATCCIGNLFTLLVDRVKNLPEKADSSKNPKAITVSVKSNSSTNLSSEKRKPLFDVFVLFMEPLLLETNGYLQLKNGVGNVLSDVHLVLKSINGLLFSLMNEKIYLRTEDTSEGSCVSFLKIVYDIVTSISSSLIRSSRFDNLDRKKMEMLAKSANEVILGIGYLLEIEYEVVGSDLTNLWLMMFSYSSLKLSSINVADRTALLYRLSDLGGRLFNLYSQLRQVNHAIFTLSKGIRLLMAHDSDNEANHTRFLTPLCEEDHAKSVGMLLCSEEFKLAVQKAVKSIPEGQVSLCLKQLVEDLSESLNWMKSDQSDPGNQFDLRAELFGRGLSELYGAVLNSLTVTLGNSYIVGMHLKDLITLLSPFMNSLVDLNPDVNKFLVSVSGKSFSKNGLKNSRVSSHWVFTCFFQLFISSRTLFGQAVSLMPPNSVTMWDSFTAFSGQHLIQRKDWSNDGYFSCFLQPSASLLVVIQAVSRVYVQESSVDSSPLIYVIHAMAVQRLVDLNRQIKSLEYLVQNNDCLVRIGLLGDDDVSRYQRRNKKLEKQISIRRQEATGLTDFITENLSLEDEYEDEGWDFNISSVNKKSLPIAIWWILCQNVDVWSIHASKKKLKLFLSRLLRSSFPFGIHQNRKTNQPSRVTIWEISLELLNNSVLYEQKFVRRDLASRFCHALEESALPFCSTSSTNIDFESSPDWPVVLADLANTGKIITGNKRTQKKAKKKPMASSITNTELSVSQSLLNLLSWIPKDFFDSKSFSLLLTSILNLERCIISNLSDLPTTLNSQGYELLNLFMTCRKVMKYLIIASGENTEASQTVVSHMYLGDSFPIIWLFKSLFVAVNIKRSLEKDAQLDRTIFSLLDHTLYVFLTLNKSHFSHSVQLIVDEPSDSDESDRCLSWETVSHIAKILKEQMQNSLALLKDDVIGDGKDGVENLNMFSSIISCFSGFIWGLVSVMKQKDDRTADSKMILSGWKDKSTPEIELCIEVFEELSSLLLGNLLFINSRYFQKENNNGDSKIITDTKSVASFLTEGDSFEEIPLDKSVLRNLVKGDSSEAAFLLRELFTASSAILGLNLHVNCASLSAKLMQTYTSVSQILLSELAELDFVPESRSLVWLDGAVKYVEELGHHFPMTDPKLSRNLFIKIAEIQMKAIGKCITLQGKRASLCGPSGLTETSLHCVDRLKCRLRLSFTSFIKKSSELHLLSALQAIERALVGVQEKSTTIYDVKTGSQDGGNVSSIVAAGIDCLDLVLEFASGRKRLNVVKRHIQSFVSCAFSIILHLRSPTIFYERLIGDRDPDSGAMVLMCVEVLIRISGKHAHYQTEACHVAQALRIPGAIFQNFCQLKISNKQCCGIDRQFSVDLFSACCRLLYNVVKHHKSEFKRCIALLEASVSVLINCLETVDSDSLLGNGCFSWKVEEGVKCAYSLRRIYEEIRHQKDVMSRHCSQLLSYYIWVYSGFGPLKTGIKREIDEALRPGLYALIDACSVADLQHLHTVLGEGPCRNTLASLQRDYKLHFQFEGKV